MSAPLDDNRVPQFDSPHLQASSSAVESNPPNDVPRGMSSGSDITYRSYAGESDLPDIMALVQYELSEPYVIYTYRYFLHEWCVCHSRHNTINRRLTMVL